MKNFGSYIVFVLFLISCHNGAKNKETPIEQYKILGTWSTQFYNLNGKVKVWHQQVYNTAYETATGWQPIANSIMLDEIKYFDTEGNLDSLISTWYNGSDSFTMTDYRSSDKKSGISYKNGKIHRYDTLERVSRLKTVIRFYDTQKKMTWFVNSEVDSLGRELSREEIYDIGSPTPKRNKTSYTYPNDTQKITGSPNKVKILKRDIHNNPLEVVSTHDGEVVGFTKSSYTYY